MSSSDSIYEVIPGQLYINYTLVRNPIFNKQFITLPFDGTFLNSEFKAYGKNTDVQMIPSYNDDSNQIQIFVSEESLSSILVALHKDEALKLEYNDIDQAPIDMVFKDFQKVYGSDNKLHLTVETVNPYPELKVSPNQTLIFSHVSMTVKNPLNLE